MLRWEIRCSHPGSLTQGFAQDFAPTAHFLIRLRVWHPVLAVISATYIIALALVAGLSRDDRATRRFAGYTGIAVGVQLIAGLVNLVLLAPVPMQLIHLLIADLVWISLVLLAANTFAENAAVSRSTDPVFVKAV